MQRGRAVVALVTALVSGGCGWFADRVPPSFNPADAKRVTLEIVARNNRCEPSVIAVDREGRAALIAFQVTSVDREHVFLIPDLFVRRRIPANAREEIQVLADRSGIHEYACNSQPWIGPFAPTGKLAIK
jgi:hypothetical protein